MDRVLKTCLSPALDDNYLSKNNTSTQVLYLNKRILSDFFQNDNCCDNIFIERLWRSLKYELIYIQTFNDGKHLTEEVKKWFNWYKGERPHQALEYQTPDEVYRKNLK